MSNTDDECNCLCHSPAHYAPHKSGHGCCDNAKSVDNTGDELDKVLARLVDMVHAKTLAKHEQVNIIYNLKEAKQAIQRLILEARIDETRKALSYTTMEELKNRHYLLVNQSGGTPFKRKFMTKTEIKKELEDEPYKG